MGRQGGQGKGKPKLKDKDFGNALINQLKNPKTKESAQMSSILDNSALDDFIITAEMDDSNAEVVHVHDHDAYLAEPTMKKFQSMESDAFLFEHLSLPRKPAWTRQMTAEEVDRQEKIAFLQWRRDISVLENSETNRRVTPYEKNIEVWRQLWRVIEKSEYCVQIVDARNPLLYYTSDLVSYASSLVPPRPIMLLINKSDFLTPYQREQWAMHFRSKGIAFVFYSAHDEQAKIDKSTLTEAAATSISADFSKDNHRVEEIAAEVCASWVKSSSSKQEAKMSETCSDDASQVPSSDTEQRITTTVLNRLQLIYLLQCLPATYGLKAQERHLGRYCVGMVGYPNVGKSSVINSILGVSKSTHGVTRVAVSSTPGKTKHFQTINVNDSIMLCDCPGLVFPSFLNSTGEMICFGILPINQMRDHVEPASIIASRIPVHLLEAAYGISIIKALDFKDNPDRPPSASEFLGAYCALKGYITGGTGRWDEFRACKDVLRDFNDGRLLYACSPPNCTDTERWFRGSESIMAKSDRVAERLCLQKLKEADLGESKANIEEPTTEHIPASEYVFEVDDTYQYDDESDSDDNIDQSIASEVLPGNASTAQGSIKREHKRLKTWGKKGKKLRDKTPYSEENGTISYVAHCTNRIGVEGKDNKGVKKSRDSTFVRVSHPHAQI